MGTFSVAIQIGDLVGQHYVEVQALVDTGSTYTVLPEDVLTQLGINKEGQRSFELGDDRLVEYPIGYARLRLGEDQTIVLVVFGPEGVSPLLGATALEHLSLAVDPIHQTLVPVPALLK
ncbi:MAG: hypothetical protein BZY81_06280 [SAR202 cluster bacterium Io17-Chloro-G4]|nr:MAG: hypothetical protein BZY81_06280 [SAR202 cluster bacterium Io17-Chloro-G4]